MSSLLSWRGRFRELVAGLIVMVSLPLVQGCAAPQGPPVQLASKPEFKVLSFGDFVGESVSEEYRLLALEVAIPAKYEMTLLADDAYWFPPERAAAVMESGDLPTDTGYFYSKISLDVGYDAERGIFVGFEDGDPAAEMRQAGFEDFEWERADLHGYPAIFTRVRDPSTKRTVHAAYIVSQNGRGVFYVAYVPPDGDPTAGASTWRAFRSALAQGMPAAPAPRAGSSAGRIASTHHDLRTGEQTTTHYSEYFEFDDRVLGGRVRVHFLITLGQERVPAGWRFPAGEFISDGRLTAGARADGVVEEVYEIYFTNLGDGPITFVPLELEVRPLGRVKLSPSPMFLEVGAFLKTDPILSIGSTYQPPEKEFLLRYSHDGREEEVAGVARRLRVDELEKR